MCYNGCMINLADLATATVTAGLQTIFLAFWIVWIVAFFVIELTALYLRKYFIDVKQNGGTLSELTWRLIRGYQWYHRIAFALLLLGYSWLGYHFFIQPLH